jgi:serpin B
LHGVSALSQPPAKINPDTAAAVQGDNVFALDLYSRLRAEKGNLFFSPYSISSALAMTYAGARGQTAEQMATTLHFSLPPDRLHPAFGDLMAQLHGANPQQKFKLSVANALWGQKGYDFLPAFLAVTKKNYGAGLQEVDFGQAEQARKTINDWVEKQTNDKIKELIKPGMLDIDTRLVLTNAIYFKAAWAEVFQAGATKKADFQTANEKVKVDMMHQGLQANHFKGDGFQVVELPYEQHQLSMLVFLPAKKDGLAEFEQGLTSAKLDGWLKSMKRHTVDLKLPKFKFTSEFSLKKVLSEMGMSLAFTKQADFSGMTTREKLYISAVVHKAFVDVHEKGTEAAAATAVIMKTLSAVIGGPMATFHADHPFVFMIRDNRTGSILFLGRVSNPG